MNRLPTPSTATPAGKNSRAAVAGPPSPLKPLLPVPATVVMTPAVSTLRIRWFHVSAMKRLPAPSTATSAGKNSRAAVAGLPSPLNPWLPKPATVVMTPAESTLRTRALY